MSDGAPPRPKPRPRPRPAKSTPRTSSTASAGPSTSVQTSPVVNDSDDFFVINRGRTKETWRKLDEINKVVARATSDSESDNGDVEPSTPSRKRAKKGTTPGKWQKTEDALRILSADTSGDSDSDIEVLSKTNTPGKGKTNVSPKKHKHRKGDSRSPSITPPPEVPAAILLNARNVIRRALEPQRASSPIIIDDFEDSTDTIVLDPELARIANNVKSQAQALNRHPIPKPSLDSETLVVTVKWRKHPLNPVEKEPTFVYTIPRDEPFRELFEQTAEDAQIMAQNLVMSHRNKRVFPSTTPSALGIWGEVEFVGCQQNTWDYLRKQALESHQNPIQVNPTYEDNTINIPDDDDPMHPPNTAPPEVNQASDAESESESTTFKLVVRSNKSPKDISLKVKPTTKCGAIVRAFLTKAGLADQYPHVFAEGGTLSKGKKGRGTKAQALPDPRLSVDGDKMDNNTEISEADLDDGDMVEVVGL